MISNRCESVLEWAGKIGIWWVGALAVSNTFGGTLHTYGVPSLLLTISAISLFWMSVFAAVASPFIYSWMRINIAALFVGWLAVAVGRLEQSLTMQDQIWWSLGYTITFALVMLAGYHKLANAPRC
jgi:hypothetical protein